MSRKYTVIGYYSNARREELISLARKMKGY